jgi:cell wall assembly regulator SMI1
VQALDRLETAWREQGAPIARNLAPGLPAERMAALEAEHDLALPEELRRWWQWHDGVVTGKVSGDDGAVGAGPWMLLSFEEAIEDRAFMMTFSDRPFDPDDWQGEWAAWFLPVVSVGNAWLFADLRAGDGERAPIHVWGHVPDDIFTAKAPSWTSVVATWTGCLESGLFTWNAGTEEWDMGWNVPPAMFALL